MVHCVKSNDEVAFDEHCIIIRERDNAGDVIVSAKRGVRFRVFT